MSAAPAPSFAPPPDRAAATARLRDALAQARITGARGTPELAPAAHDYAAACAARGRTREATLAALATLAGIYGGRRGPGGDAGPVAAYLAHCVRATYRATS
jgi:hypothetical protein